MFASLQEFIHLFTFWVVIPLIAVTGILLTYRLRFIQVRGLVGGFRHLLDGESSGKGSITNFQAISAVLAGNLGTGNISGMAIALSLGGPGALPWMWIMGFLGMAIKYAACVLGVRYRHINEVGEYVGGPMYYLHQGAGMRWLALLFCVASVGAALTVGNLVQVNSLILPIKSSGVSPLLAGVVMAAIVAVTLVGGLARIVHVVTAVVPAMTLMYLGGAVAILSFHASEVPGALWMMLQGAFTPSSIMGGAAGYSITHAMTAGFERGIFATDAGTGIAPVLQSGARTRSAEAEGQVAMVPPVVVLFVCTITTLVLIVTGAWQTEGLQSTTMCTWAFQQGLGHPSAHWIVITALLLFGFTTILAWAFCAEKAIEYAIGLHAVKWFNLLFVLVIPLGAIAKVELVWSLADIAIALMLCCNLVGVLRLAGQIIEQPE